jgi:transcriptional regulator with XRE-family HTH domain
VTAQTDALYAALGRNIAAARMACHVNQEDLAHVARLTRSSIANIEAGRQHPPLHVLVAIAGALQVDIGAFLSGDAAQLANADLKFGYRRGYRRGWKNCLAAVRESVNAKLDVPVIDALDDEEEDDD